MNLRGHGHPVQPSKTLPQKKKLSNHAVKFKCKNKVTKITENYKIKHSCSKFVVINNYVKKLIM